jgi:hypothetical protein
MCVQECVQRYVSRSSKPKSRLPLRWMEGEQERDRESEKENKL